MEKEHGLTLLLLGTILKWLLWIVLAGFLAVLIVTISQLFLGQNFVFNYLKLLTANEINFFSQTHSITWLLSNPLEIIKTILLKIEHLIWQGLNLQDGLSYLKEIQQKPITKNPFEKGLASNVPLLKNYATILITTVQLFTIRVIVTLLFLPLFWLFGLIALVDGLTQRHLRKLQGARESSLIYHRARSATVPCFIASSFLYLIAPVLINPIILFLSFAVLFSIVLSITVRTFKKYL